MFPWVFVAAVAFWATALGGGFYFALRLVRALERRAGNELALSELRQRVAHLEGVLAGTPRDVKRLDSAEIVTNRVLGDRPSGSNP